MFTRITPIVLLLFLSASPTSAQTSAFSYDGKLSNSGSPASGAYDFEFKLFDTPGVQQGSTIQRLNVAVANGAFNVSLDFGMEVFTGDPRFLEISVRVAGGGSFTVLSPRQQILSAPYAIKSAGAMKADKLSMECVNCVIDAQIAGLAGAKIVGAIPPASVPAGSTSYIQNGTTLQPASDFNIGGAGSANILNAAAQYNLGGGRVLSMAGTNNFFAGLNAGLANTTGSFNSFFGNSAGQSNLTGTGNAFFGNIAGVANTTGDSNSFFGFFSGAANTTGFGNSYFGNMAGHASTTGGLNAFFGNAAGFANLSDANAFFGYNSGSSNTTACCNAFFGANAGSANTTGGSNAFFGYNAGVANTTAFGNSFFGNVAGSANTTGQSNSFFGTSAGQANNTGFANSFFGAGAGQANATGGLNAFFGYRSGFANLNDANAFFGYSAGSSNTTACCNAFFGANAGSANTTGGSNAFFGYNAGVVNTTAFGNSFFGNSAGSSNTGSSNVFIGSAAGLQNTTGSGNTYVGTDAGRFITTAANNTLIGFQATAAENISNSTAIGYNSIVNSNNTVVLGTSGNTVQVPGNLNISGNLSKGGGSFRIDHPLDPLNKTLSHSFVESPDMMNIYNGNVVTDRRGQATITLPEWFGALNRDFRYQLTVIGTFAQAIVAREIRDNSFTIKTSAPNVKVSWQVTGIRQDAYANKHRIPVEEEKPSNQRGAYLHPDAFEKSASQASTRRPLNRSRHMR